MVNKMVSENVKKKVEEIKSMVMRDAQYIELVATIYYLINLIEPSKREMFNEALNSAEDLEDLNELFEAIKLQLGSQGAKKRLFSV